MEMRRAVPSDLDGIMPLIAQAKAFLRSMGVDQWQKAYPARSDIEADLRDGNGYVLMDGGGIVGYACISFDGEPAYDTLVGEWRSGQPYAVIHRMAVDDRCKGKGLASRMFEYAEGLCAERGVGYIRIDTDQDNAVMQHLLGKHGYAYRGVMQYDNSEKIAFDKLL